MGIKSSFVLKDIQFVNCFFWQEDEMKGAQDISGAESEGAALRLDYPNKFINHAMRRTQRNRGRTKQFSLAFGILRNESSDRMFMKRERKERRESN